MLLSHECPSCLLCLSSKFNDFNYYIDVLMLDKSYNDYFRNNIKTTYLDCSLYERNFIRSIEDLDLDIYKSLYKKLSSLFETYVIVPDYKDSSTKCIEEIKKFKDIKKKILTVHGRTKKEFLDCFRYYLDNTDDDNIIAISGIDSFCKLDSRVEILEQVDTNRKIHIFGLISPKEIELLSEVKDKIFSLDTSLPITATIQGLKIDELKEKPNYFIFKNFHAKINLDDSFKELLNYNLNYIKMKLK